jgi:TRAP-type uncharacterized transport system fused permease subunit
METGLQSMRLGITTYIVPFFFVLNPALILHGPAWEIVYTIITCAVGLWVIGSSLEGYSIGIGRLPVWSRPCLFISGLLLGYPVGWITDIVGIVIVMSFMVLVVITKRISGPSQHKM